jgi:hypothetical protein
VSGIKYAALVILLVVLALLMIEFNSRTAELNRLLTEQEVVAAQYNESIQTKAALEAELAYATSDAAVVEYAYENNMTRDGDIPVVLLQSAAPTPTPQPAPVVIQTQEAKWQRWLALFWDDLSERSRKNLTNTP